MPERILLTNGLNVTIDRDFSVSIQLPTITVNGLTITVGSFAMPNGYKFNGGTVVAFPEATQFLCLAPITGTLHVLTRNITDGVIWLARITTSNATALTMELYTLDVPVTSIPRALAKLQEGVLTRVGLIGSSLFQIFQPDNRSTTGWITNLFQPGGGFSGNSLVITNKYSAIKNRTPFNRRTESTTRNLVYNPRFEQGISVWDGGSPTGFSIIAGVGPNNETVVQWSGAGRFFQDMNWFLNSPVVGSIDCKAISGTPTITIQVKNVFSDTVVCQISGTPDTSSWLKITTQQALLYGGTDGSRVEFQVSGGTVQFTNITLVRSLMSNFIVNSQFDTVSTWGSPTGFTILPTGGPNGESALQWAGAGALLQDLNIGNQWFSTSFHVFAVATTATVTVGYNIKGTGSQLTSFTYTVTAGTWTLIMIPNYLPSDATTGIRITISVTGATIRLTNVGVYTTNVLWDSYAVGGANVRYMSSLAAYSINPTTTGVGNTSTLAYGQIPSQFALAPSNKPQLLSRAYDYDLVILGLYPNGGTDKLAFYEAVVKNFRARDVEVLLVTDNSDNYTASVAVTGNPGDTSLTLIATRPLDLKFNTKIYLSNGMVVTTSGLPVGASQTVNTTNTAIQLTVGLNATVPSGTSAYLFIGNDTPEAGDGALDAGSFIKQLADTYGCGIADTAAFLQELTWRALSPYTDSIHPNQIGSIGWCEAVASTLSTNEKLPTKNSKLLLPSSPPTIVQPVGGISRQFGYIALPGRFDLDLTPANTGGSNSTSWVNPYANLYGYGSNKAITLTTGNTIRIGHPLMLSADIICDSSSSWAGTFTGTSSGSINFTTPGAGVRPASVEFITAALTTATATGNPISGGYTLTITSGTLVLYGICYHCPDYLDITDTFRTSGTFTSQVTGYSNSRMLSNAAGVSGDYVWTRFTGRSIAVILQRNTGAGILTPFIDGVQQSTIDLYAVSTSLTPYIFKAPSTAYGEHQFTLQWNGTQNASAVAGTATNPRLPFVQAFSILDR